MRNLQRVLHNRLIEPMVAVALAALMIAVAFVGCTDPPVTPTPNPVTGGEAALLPVTYFHVKDSDGSKPGADVDVALIFEPGGITHCYTARDLDAIARRGTYAYADGKLTLKYTDADFKADATFALDTAQETVTMPFRAFSTEPGSSTWRRARLPIEASLVAIFKASTLAEELPTDKAIERVTAYGNAIAAIRKKEKAAGKRTSTSGLFDPTLNAVAPLANGVTLQYEDAPAISVQLFGWSIRPGVPLATSQLAGDPRVHLDPEPPRKGQDDPDEKTALFIAPFNEDRGSLVWYDYEFFGLHYGRHATPAWHRGFGGADKFDALVPTLTDRGYSVKKLYNDDATPISIAEAIIPGLGGRLRAPGIIMVSTHGSSDGTLTTGVDLGDTTINPLQKFAEYVEQIKDAGYADMITFNGGTSKQPKTIRIVMIGSTMRVRDLHYYVAITPSYWTWLRTRQANFTKSLVFIGACLTDKTDTLREAITARAYFAFNVSVYADYSGALAQYIVKFLARPTHTAEEMYYNVVRISTTKQMIYKEDKLLDGLTSNGNTQFDSTRIMFQGYAFDGLDVKPFMSAGWLKTSGIDQGGLWWILFAARWSPRPSDGAAGLKNCWDEFYSKGKLPGLADPGCQNKAPGRVPTQAEIAYATYLLTGTPVVPTVGYRFPRWTMNDGR